MMLRACVNARASSDDEVRFCLRLMPSSAAGWETWDLRSPDGRRTCLCALVVRYTYDSSVQALDSRTARRTTTRAVNGPKAQHAVGSKFAFESPMGGSHAAREECGDPKKSGFSLAVFFFLPPCIARHRPSCRRETQPKTASAGKQQLWSTTTRQ